MPQARLWIVLITVHYAYRILSYPILSSHLPIVCAVNNKVARFVQPDGVPSLLGFANLARWSSALQAGTAGELSLRGCRHYIEYSVIQGFVEEVHLVHSSSAYSTLVCIRQIEVNVKWPTMKFSINWHHVEAHHRELCTQLSAVEPSCYRGVLMLGKGIWIGHCQMTGWTKAAPS